MLNLDHDPTGAARDPGHDDAVGQRLWDLALHIATAGHDLNNLLTIVSGNIQFAMEQDDRPVATEIQLSIHALDRAITLLGSIMRGDSVGTSLEVSDVPLVVEETIRLTRALWSDIPAFVLTTEMHACARAAISDHVVRRIVLNVLMNAVAAMPAGGQLHVAVRDDPPWVTVRVQDSGQGMRADFVAQITQPFTGQHATGSGLGLTSCARLLRTHHGHMDITSSIGIGTTVVIRLPMVSAERTA